jgi:hypothetical protein
VLQEADAKLVGNEISKMCIPLLALCFKPPYVSLLHAGTPPSATWQRSTPVHQKERGSRPSTPDNQSRFFPPHSPARARAVTPSLELVPGDDPTLLIKIMAQLLQLLGTTSWCTDDESLSLFSCYNDTSVSCNMVFESNNENADSFDGVTIGR